jgi:hypothetical protein
MSNSKRAAAVVVSVLLLLCLGGCGQAASSADGITPVRVGSPIPSTSHPNPTTPYASATPTTGTPHSASAGPTGRAAAQTSPTIPKAPTPKASKKATVKPAGGATTKTAATTAPAAPTFKYTPPSTVGILTLTCTWTGSEVVASAQWSGYPGIYMTVSAPGLTDTTDTPANGDRVHGTRGLHGTCTASGGGQNRSATA